MNAPKYWKVKASDGTWTEFRFYPSTKTLFELRGLQESAAREVTPQ